MANSRFSLTEYFTHIGLPDYRPEPTLACLRDICFQHLITFPYESSRLFQEGKKPAKQRKMASLDPDITFDEMVNKKMPAYCYQNNGLLYAVLSRVGFNVSRHFAKVMLTARDKVDAAAVARQHVTHLTLTVRINGYDYLVDTGFSNESLRQPLPLSAGTHQFESEEYRLEELEDHWVLNSLRHDHDKQPYWYGLFRFDKMPVNDTDIYKAHHDLYFADNIPIRSDMLLFSRVSEQKRKYVCWTESEKSGTFRSVKNDGSTRDVKKFDSEAAAVEFAREKFRLK